MNGVHDMGGMHGFGPVRHDPDEPLFHAPWEARALALTLAVGALGRWTLDASRHARERIPGEQYLPMTYYERWIAGLEMLLAESDLTDAPAGSVMAVAPVDMTARLARGAPADRVARSPPRFAVGDPVRARNLNPHGHIRLPRYVKGHTGTIARLHGTHVLPDAAAHGDRDAAEPLYQVRFEAAELFGPAAGRRGAVFADLWESYLDPA
jgi:nitrile hydratase